MAFMEIAAAAEYMDTTPGALYKAVQRGSVPYFRRGKRILFSQARLEKWAEDNEVATGERRQAGETRSGKVSPKLGAGEFAHTDSSATEN